MSPNPSGGCFLRETAACYLKHHDVLLLGWGINIVAVQAEKRSANDPGDPLVPIDKRMIARNPMRIARCKLGKVGSVSVGKSVPRSGKRRFQKRHISNPIGTTVLSALPHMDGEHDIVSNPDRLFHAAYSASFRSTSRSSRITCSASSI